MKFSCNFQRQNMFRGADCFLPTRKVSTKLRSKGFWDPRIDSQVRLASRLNIKVPYRGLLASGFTEKFYGHLLPRKLEGIPLVCRLSCQGEDSFGDINGYDPNNNDTHKADKELEARRSKDSMIDEVSNLSMALGDEAARAWIDIKQTLSAVQEMTAEESCFNEAFQMATMEVDLAKGRLHESLKARDKEEAILYAQNVNEWLAKLTSIHDQLRGLQAKKDELLKKENRLKEAAMRSHPIALEVEEDITELMTWAKRSVMNDAGDKTNKRNHSEVLVREAVELDDANHELEAIRSRNSIISKGIDQLISLEEEAAHAWNDAKQIFHVVQEMIIEESVAKEPVQKAVIILSPDKESSEKEIKEMLENLASLQNLFMCLQIEKCKLIKEANRLSETGKRAQSLALEAEEEVMEMMIWGEQSMTLEREAIRRLNDAKTALKIAEKSHGKVLVREAIELDEANQELEAIRSRNSMISKGIDQMISLEEEAVNAQNDANQTIHVVQETIAQESVAKESVQKAVIALSLGKESSKHEMKKMLENLGRLQDKQICLQIKKQELLKEANRLSESAKRAHNSALEKEEEVIEMMVWGEQALTLEREAIDRLNDAETALKIAEKSHGRELDRESTIVDEDVSHQAERKLSVNPSAKRDMPKGAFTGPHTGASSS